MARHGAAGRGRLPRGEEEGEARHGAAGRGQARSGAACHPEARFKVQREEVNMGSITCDFCKHYHEAPGDRPRKCPATGRKVWPGDCAEECPFLVTTIRGESLRC